MSVESGMRCLSAAAGGVLVPERRSGYERRKLSLGAFIRGGFTPRRRGGRRHDERLALVDWHEPQLLVATIAILLLSVTDALLTLTLLTRGAEEANPVLAWILMHHPQMFAAVKMVLTGGGLVVLVALARARVFRGIRVTSLIHACLAVYVALIGYEWWMLRQSL